MRHSQKCPFHLLVEASTKNEARINGGLIGAQGKRDDVGGYYLPNDADGGGVCSLR